MMNQTDKKIYLASKSPRRRNLLRQIGVEFELLPFSPLTEGKADMINEDVLPGELPHDYVRRISRQKADFAWHALELRYRLLRPILTADTTVALGNHILGKPQDKKEAVAMLKELSGKTHQVLTCVTLKKKDNLLQELQVSEVTFADLSDEEINNYCNTLEPYDKAGGYGIQGLAAKFIVRISGSYSGIVGLPLFETTRLLRQAGIDIP